MLKQKRQLFELLFMGCDLAVVSSAWIIAYWIRFYTDAIPVENGVPPFSNYLPMLIFIWTIWAFVFRRLGLYKPMRGVRRTQEVWQLINANLFALLLFIAITYLFREKSVPFSRLVFVLFGILTIVLTLAERSVLRSLLREVRRRGYNLRFLLLVGAGKVAGDIVSRIRMHRELGIQVIGCLSRDGVANGSVPEKGPWGIPIVGSYGDLQSILRSRELDQIVVALPLEDHAQLPHIIETLRDSVVDVKIVPDLYQFVSVGGTIEEFEGLPVIGVQDSPIDGMNLYAKRSFDFVVASILLVVLSPLLVAIALAVKLTSRGPVFYRQQRVSYDGSSFTIIKFRTMSVDAEASGPGWTTEGDPRVTKLGQILRRCNLDELPQLVNVFCGDMSLVGPRPERPVFIQQFRTKIPRYMLRHKVPAGMTGWAQVHGWRGDTSIDKRLEYDLYYIQHWSIVLDFKIMIMTVMQGLRSRNAY